MKRGVILIFLVLIIPLVMAVTGEAITGDAQKAPTDVSVFVLPGPPIIYIHSPENKTYYNTNILFNYSIGNEIDIVWYKLDNSENISLGNYSNNSLYFDTTLGSHILYLFANNSYGITEANVSFTVAEQQEEPPPENGNGNGGGGGDSSENRGLIVEPGLIEVTVLQGENTIEILNITNAGDVLLDITIDLGNLSEFLEVSEKSFSLEAGEFKEFIIKISVNEKEVPESYIGKIIVKGNNIQKTVNFIINIREKKPLFDLVAKILSKRINPGDTIITNFEIINLGQLKNIDILFYYSIKDFEGNVLAFKEESIAIETNLDIERKIELPADIDYGSYVLHSKISYKNITASSTEAFEVVEKIKIPKWVLILCVILILIIIVIFMIRKLMKKKTKKKKKK